MSSKILKIYVSDLLSHRLKESDLFSQSLKELIKINPKNTDSINLT